MRVQAAGEPLNPASATFREELVRLVRRRLRSEADAEDVIQDVLVRLTAKPEAIPAGPPAAWLHRVVANASADHFRRRAREARALGNALAEERVRWSGTQPEEGEAERLREEIAPCLRSLLAGLGAEDREALSLTDLGRLSQREAAARLGISYSAMKSRVQRGRARLRASLLDCCRFEVDARGAPVAAERNRTAGEDPCEVCTGNEGG